MKILKKLTAALMVLPFLAGLTACSEQYADYDPSNTTDGFDVPHLVYFPQSVVSVTSMELSEKENSFDVTLERDSVDGDIVVNFEITQSAPGTLNIPENVSMADGESSLTFTISYDPDAIIAKGGITDTVTIKIVDGDNFNAHYNGGSWTFVASLYPMTPWCSTVEEFEEAGGQGDFPLGTIGTGTYTYSLFFSGDDPELPVSFRQSQLNQNVGQFKIEEWAYGVDFIFDAEWDAAKNYWRLTVPTTYIGYDHSSYGPVYAGDYIGYYDFSGKGELTWETLERNGLESYYDPGTGRFNLYLLYYVPQGVFDEGVEVFQVDGFKSYEANIYEDFDWTLKYEGDFISSQLNATNPAILYEGVCTNTTDACDSVFAATYGTAYKLESPYAQGYDIYFCVDSEGNIVNPNGLNEDGSALQATGLVALGTPVYAKINAKNGSYAEKKVALNITFVNEDETIEYGTSTEVFSAVSWKVLGQGIYTEDLLTTFWDVENLSYEVEVQENEDVPGHYRLKNPYGEAYLYNEPGDWDDSKDYYMEIHAEDPQKVYIPFQELGFDWGYGMISIWSMADYNGSSFGTLKDGVITFPGESLLISMANYNNGGLYYANSNGAFKVVLPDAAKGIKLHNAPAKTNRTFKRTAKVAAKGYTRNVNWTGNQVIKNQRSLNGALAKRLLNK